MMDPMDGLNGASDFNMDDLFGEDEGNGVVPVDAGLIQDAVQLAPDATVQLATAVSMAATPPAVLEALDTLRHTGCSHKIDWSKFGAIAYITNDQRSLRIRCPQYSRQVGKWVLSSEHETPIKLSAEATPLVHLSWNSVGNHIAVFNASGRLWILGNTPALSHTAIFTRIDRDVESEMGAVVGMYWLPASHQRKITHFEAVKEGQHWEYKTSQESIKGPYNPIESRSAFVRVSRDGTVRLHFELSDHRWNAVRTWLFLDSASPLNLTHAAFAPSNDGSLLLVTSDTSQQIRLHKLSIDFHASPENQKQPSGIQPTISAALLDVAQCFNPAPTEPGVIPQPALLSHLAITSGDSMAGGHQEAPLIMAVLSSPSSSFDYTPSPQTERSHVLVYEVVSKTLDLHPTFSKNNKPAGSEDWILQRVPDSDFNDEIILGICPIDYNHTYAFVHSNGQVTYRYPTEFFKSEEPKGFSHIRRGGLELRIPGQPLQVAFSPNACAAAVLDDEDTVSVHYLEVREPAQLEPEDGAPSDTLAYAAAQFAQACQNSDSTDDILAVLRPHDDSEIRHVFITECFKALKVQLDCTTDEAVKQKHALLFRNVAQQKCLGAQAVLGRNASGRSDLTGKLAWVILNLRITCIALGTTMQGNPQNLRPEPICSLEETARWCIDLLTYMLDELMTLGITLYTKKTMDLPSIQAAMASSNSPALLLILNSISRELLKMMLNYLGMASTFAKRDPTTHNSSPATSSHDRLHSQLQGRTLKSFAAIIDHSPINLKAITSMILNPVDKVVRDAYVNAKLTPQQRNEHERNMLVRGTIPSELAKTSFSILQAAIRLSKREDSGMDRMKIHFYDYRWLGLTDDRNARQYGEKHEFDIIRKVDLSALAKRGKRRRCLKCAAAVEDPVADSSKVSQSHPLAWAMLLGKTCICGGNWMVDDEKKATVTNGAS